jgi:acyl-coenzyme A synthetase/AMP-(fatty) acid ligase
MSNLPLISMHAMDDNVAWKNGRRISAAQFIEDAVALAKALPSRRHVLNLSRDRYHFIVGLGAAMIARRVTLLPPGHGEAAIRDIRRDFGDLCCLADHEDNPAGIETVRVPAGARSPVMHEIPAFPGEQPAAIVFTSGSTGPPTPHVKSWGSLVRGACALGRHLGLTRTSRPSIVGAVPPQHMFGLETTVMLPLQWCGALEAGQPLLPFDVKAAVDATAAPRWLMTTPLHLRAWVRDGIDLRGSLRGVISSTMPLDAGLAGCAEDRCGCPVEEIYGCSETGVIAMRRTASGPNWTLCEGVRMETQDGVTRVVGGHIEQPFALTDLVEIAGHDSFRLLGRASDLIKVAGKRTSLEALNARLRKVPGVADGVFYIPSAPDNRAGRPAAFAVAPGTTAKAILEALRKDLDPVFLPRPLYLIDALPRTANGKIAQEGLEALARSMSARRYSDERSGR